MASLNGIVGNLTDTEFQIGGTRFFVAKLPAMAAFDLLEVIRHELGKSTSLRLPDATSEGAVGSLLQMVLSHVFDNPEWSTLIIGNGPPLTAGGQSRQMLNLRVWW